MKRSLAILLAVLMVCSTVGCRANTVEEPSTTVTTVATTAAETSGEGGTEPSTSDSGATTTIADDTGLQKPARPTDSSAETLGSANSSTQKTTTAVTQTTTAAGKKTTAKTTTKTTVKTTTAKTSVKTTTTKGGGAEANTAVVLTEPADGYLVESQAPLIDYYLSLTSDRDAAEFMYATYYGMAHSAAFTASWQSRGRLFRVYVSDDPDFRDAEEIVTMKTSVTIANLMPGRTYYWKVVNTYGESSAVRRVVTEPTQVRWIDADGGDNIRDLGGWKTESGKTVRYELLYRGASIDGYNGGPKLTADGKDVFKRQLGIRTEIDIRGTDALSTSSPFGATYLRAAITQYDYLFADEESKRSLGKIFECLSRESSYPVYFHCNAGADRTGTLAFLINGLLGVSRADLDRDFELTSFSKRGKRLRSAIDEATMTFKPDGVMQYGDGNYVAWGPLYTTMMRDYGAAGGKLSDAIAAFLETECGVTQQQIDAVRRILLTNA